MSIKKSLSEIADSSKAVHLLHIRSAVRRCPFRHRVGYSRLASSPYLGSECTLWANAPGDAFVRWKALSSHCMTEFSTLKSSTRLCCQARTRSVELRTTRRRVSPVPASERVSAQNVAVVQAKRNYSVHERHMPVSQSSIPRAAIVGPHCMLCALCCDLTCRFAPTW